MAEEKKSRSKRPSSKSKRTKAADIEGDKRREIEGPEKNVNENTVENGVEEIKADKQHRPSKKRRHGDDAGGVLAPLSEGREGDDERRKKKKRVSFAADEQMGVDGREDDARLEATPLSKEQGGDADDENKEELSKEERKRIKREKREKRDKKKKVAGDPASNSNGPTNTDTTNGSKNGVSPLLSYLGLYYNNRPAWKFQKIREIQLFKHILSLEHVPAEYDAALLAYLQGLRGESAKQRLREVAQAALKKDVEETKPEANIELSENPADEKVSPTTNYRKAVYAFRTKLTEGDLSNDLGEAFEQLDADLKERFRKRRRAEIILFALDGRVFTMANLKAPPQKGKNANQNQPANKKKKNRTAFVEISSSSESGSDSDDYKEKASAPSQAAKKKKKSRTAVVDISSSSEDSSDSDSEDDKQSVKMQNRRPVKKKKSRTAVMESSSSTSESESSSSSSSDSSSDSD
ncbi:hypothetical protein BJX61DRAFT_42397 [Aspergillus egyptiacus]|nr:hypothetical protein BJX61DRAFT_42397 [Aspergillus egyptiacus]